MQIKMVPAFTLKTSRLQQTLYLNSSLFHALKRLKTSTPPPETSVFLQKNISDEEPIFLIAAKNEQSIDIIGPPNALSNLRPIIRKHVHKETTLQQKLRQLQDSTQLWNQNFWATHNTNFIKERKEFIQKHQIAGEETKQLTADEMSEFYKMFLDKNWETHVKYNLEWYKRNFTLLYLAFRVQIDSYLAKFS